jgi:hypothetical protein
MVQTTEKTISVSFDIQGLGFTPNTKYTNASSYWSGASSTGAKASKVISEFSDMDIAISSYFLRSYGEENNKEAGIISVNLELTGDSGVMHTYETTNNIEWTYPNRAISMNGRILGTGETALERKNSAIGFYQTYGFDSAASGSASYEMSGGSVYLKNQNLSINHKTGEITYQREYVYNELSYQDTWTLDYQEAEDSSVSIKMQGNLIGLNPIKEARWTSLISAFNTIFSSESAIWTSKVSTILGTLTPPTGYVVSRGITYDKTNGAIGYAYDWSSSATSGIIDYDIAGEYNLEDDFWQITLNGTIHGAGSTRSAKIQNAVSIKPQEQAAWTYAYNNFVSLISSGVSATGDNPAITLISNNRNMISRNESVNEKAAVYNFSFVWSCSENSYSHTYSDQYQWDEQSATETVTRNGRIRSTTVANMYNGWDAVWNSGDPAIPASIYASRHTTEATGVDTLPTSSPISNTAKFSSVATFNRAAVLSSSSCDADEKNKTITYTNVYTYKSWLINTLPLWITMLDIKVTKNNPVSIWAEHNIIGKQTGPVYQDMTAKTGTSYSISITIGTTKRKADKFGQYLQVLLEEYADYVLTYIFTKYTGYTKYIISGTTRNCFIKSDTIDKDLINGSLTRNVSITMLSNLA